MRRWERSTCIGGGARAVLPGGGGGGGSGMVHKLINGCENLVVI